MTNLPAGHQCGACGGRVESLVVDWADDDGRQVVAEKVPMFCAACASSLAGRRTLVDPDSQIEVAVEGVDGLRGFSAKIKGPRGGTSCRPILWPVHGGPLPDS